MSMSPRLLRPRSTATFSPSQLSGLALWLDGTSGLYDATSGGSTVAVGGSVARWEDRSQSGLHYTQSTSGARPTAASGGGVDFDGTDDLLSNAAGTAPFFGKSTYTFSIAFDVDSFSNEPVLFGLDVTQGGSVSQWIELSSQSANVAYWGATSSFRTYPVSGNYALSAGTRYIITAVRTGDTTGALYINGSALAGATGNLAALAVRNNQIGVVGAYNNNFFLNGRIREVICLSRDASTSERQKLEGYLAWKYGLQASLPYDHPYAASFPGYAPQTMPSDADALAYLSAVRTADGGTGVEVGVANAVDSFVKGCKADGTWSAIKASCILAGARTLSGALVPLAGTAPTNVNFVAADYNRKTGLIGNGSTKYLNSNRLDNADSLNDVHLSTYVSAVTSAFKMYGGTQSHYIYRDNTDVYFLSRNATAIVGSSGSLTGLYGHSRAASGSFTSRVGGTTNTHSVASGLATGTNVYVFGRNVSDAINSASNGRLAFYSIGSAIDLALLDTRVSALYTAIGAAI